METKWMCQYSLRLYLKTSTLICLLLLEPSFCRPPPLEANDDTLVKNHGVEHVKDIDQIHPNHIDSQNVALNGAENIDVLEPAEKHEPDRDIHIQRQPDEADNEDDKDDDDVIEHVAPPLKLDKEAFDDKSVEKKLVELSRGKARLSPDALLPPDHMDGVRMEQDGHINREYRKEILIGNHEEFEEASETEQENKLSEIFSLMDEDQDEKLTQQELSAWIQTKVQEHFDEAMEETDSVFQHLDGNSDGFVAWTEFHMHFLLAKGFHPKEAAKHVVDYEAVNLDPNVKERLIRYKFRWAEADVVPQDNQLTLEEFKNFRHPERSTAMLGELVRELLESLDGNGDDIITEDEFVSLPMGQVDEAYQESDKLWQDERRKEFREAIDLNKDGKLTKDELRQYVDPGNPNHSEIEAENLIALADDNGDGVLSREEVLENIDLFLGSKVVDTGRNFHDEF